MSIHFLIVYDTVLFETSKKFAILRCDNFSSYNLCTKDLLPGLIAISELIK